MECFFLKRYMFGHFFKCTTCYIQRTFKSNIPIMFAKMECCIIKSNMSKTGHFEMFSLVIGNVLSTDVCQLGCIFYHRIFFNKSVTVSNDCTLTPAVNVMNRWVYGLISEVANMWSAWATVRVCYHNRFSRSRCSVKLSVWFCVLHSSCVSWPPRCSSRPSFPLGPRWLPAAGVKSQRKEFILKRVALLRVWADASVSTVTLTRASSAVTVLWELGTSSESALQEQKKHLNRLSRW